MAGFSIRFFFYNVIAIVLRLTATIASNFLKKINKLIHEHWQLYRS